MAHGYDSEYPYPILMAGVMWHVRGSKSDWQHASTQVSIIRVSCWWIDYKLKSLFQVQWIKTTKMKHSKFRPSWRDFNCFETWTWRYIQMCNTARLMRMDMTSTLWSIMDVSCLWTFLLLWFVIRQVESQLVVTIPRLGQVSSHLSRLVFSGKNYLYFQLRNLSWKNKIFIEWSQWQFTNHKVYLNNKQLWIDT